MLNFCAGAEETGQLFQADVSLQSLLPAVSTPTCQSSSANRESSKHSAAAGASTLLVLTVAVQRSEGHPQVLSSPLRPCIGIIHLAALAVFCCVITHCVSGHNKLQY